MPIHHKVVSILIALIIFTIILNLIRRRELREEYSWLWLLIGSIIIILSLWNDLLVVVGNLIGAVLPTSTLFFCAIIFLVMLCLQFSVRISKLTGQVKNISQELTILKAKMDEQHR